MNVKFYTEDKMYVSLTHTHEKLKENVFVWIYLIFFLVCV